MSEFKLTCKYCGKEIKEALNHEDYKHLQGLIAHPECYITNNREINISRTEEK